MATAKKAVAKKSVKTTVIETHHDRVDWRSLYLYAVCLITLLVVLFNTFAIVQYLQYKKVGKWSDYIMGEKTYITLSLIAKSALAWQIFASTLVG